MRLFAQPDLEVNNRFDRATWMTIPFDLNLVVVAVGVSMACFISVGSLLGGVVDSDGLLSADVSTGSRLGGTVTIGN